MACPGPTWLIINRPGIGILAIFCLVHCIFLWSFGLVCKIAVLGIKALVEETLAKALAWFSPRLLVSLGVLGRGSPPDCPTGYQGDF